jgi:hypothetical protein
MGIVALIKYKQLKKLATSFWKGKSRLFGRKRLG